MIQAEANKKPEVKFTMNKKKKATLKIPDQKYQRKVRRIPTQNLKKVVKDEVEDITKFVKFKLMGNYCSLKMVGNILQAASVDDKLSIQ